LKSFGNFFEELTSRGFKPKLQKMDNAATAALKTYLTENDMTYQLVPQYCHRRNTAEHAIRNFPMHLWDRLLSQAHQGCNQNTQRQLFFMARLITTKQCLPHQGAKSFHTRNRHKDELGPLLTSQATNYAQQCIITDVKIYI
jgi:hypothetical protein